ncbi:unnamed protein product [Prunus armeniaca]|uniref:Uncharacterized protein n=1 Tax=Prunus armeniaca TaxID=36596 RepID=A0A6J5XX68_PRUAR|nr:unnamed protein product [Prunus armeniaca]
MWEKRTTHGMKRKPAQVLMPHNASSAKIISYLKTLHTKASAPTANYGYELRASSLIPCPTKNSTADKNSNKPMTTLLQLCQMTSTWKNFQDT